VDGRGLEPLLDATPPLPGNWRTGILLEQHFDQVAPPYWAVLRHTRFYVEYPRTGETGYYNLAKDPYGLASKHETMRSALKQDLRDKRDAQRSAKGRTAAPPSSVSASRLR
jgi:hypothetical protein